jgi:RNA polymerase sigma-70 factor (ECF subfamily)
MLGENFQPLAEMPAMSRGESFEDLLARLRAGDDDAATEVFNRFARRLIGLAHARLDQQVKRKADPEDVVQSVYKSFFVRFAEGQFDLKSWDSLWSLLTVLTVRKCGQHIDYFHAARRDVRGEVPMSPGPAGDDARTPWEAIDRDPTPAEAAVLTELVEQVQRGLEPRHRAIVSLALQGHGPAEVSAQLGCSERTVRRVLERVREWLLRNA